MSIVDIAFVYELFMLSSVKTQKSQVCRYFLLQRLIPVFLSFFLSLLRFGFLVDGYRRLSQLLKLDKILLEVMVHPWLVNPLVTIYL